MTDKKTLLLGGLGILSLTFMVAWLVGNYAVASPSYPLYQPPPPGKPAGGGATAGHQPTALNAGVHNAASTNSLAHQSTFGGNHMVSVGHQTTLSHSANSLHAAGTHNVVSTNSFSHQGGYAILVGLFLFAAIVVGSVWREKKKSETEHNIQHDTALSTTNPATIVSVPGS